MGSSCFKTCSKTQASIALSSGKAELADILRDDRFPEMVQNVMARRNSDHNLEPVNTDTDNIPETTTVTSTDKNKSPKARKTPNTKENKKPKVTMKFYLHSIIIKIKYSLSSYLIKLKLCNAA